MPGEPGQDQPAGPAAPGRPRAGPVAVVTGGSAGRAAGALTEQVLAGHGRPGVLVTSAGIQARGTVDQLPVADLRACLEDGAAGTWLACRAAAPVRAAGYGRIAAPGQRAGPGRGRRPGPGPPPATAPWPGSPAAWPPGWPAPPCS